MDVLDALILGVVQGITEFLPVSSSGHLSLVQPLLGMEDIDKNVAFDVAVHVATLGVVLLATGREVLALARQRPGLMLLTLLGTAPAGVAYFLLADSIKALKSPPIVAGLLMLMGVALIVGEKTARACNRELATIRPRDAILVGLAQALALAPGISRSGTTILTGLHCKLSRQAAFTFSFLLYLPVVAGAAIVKAGKIGEITAEDPGPMAVGFVAAFVTGLAAFWVLRKVVLAGRLAWFGAYCLGIGGITLAVIGLWL